MKKKIIQFLFLILPFICSAQEYIDLFNVNYGKSQKTTFDNSSVSTNISTFSTNLVIPVILNEKYTAVAGINYFSYNLQLFPDSKNTSLYSTAVRAGLKINHSEHWSGLYILIPKVASDYKNISGEDFYFGGAAVLKYRRNENFGYSFGMYGSSEAYGISMTPIIGLYYHSPDSRFEMNFFLPNDADINYSLAENTKLGLDYLGHGNTYKLTTDNIRSTYVENNSIDFSSYIQQSMFDKKILLRLKMGYSLNEFRVYPIDQKLDLQVLILKFGDKRTRLLEDKSNSLFFKIEGIYRFDLNSLKK